MKKNVLLAAMIAATLSVSAQQKLTSLLRPISLQIAQLESSSRFRMKLATGILLL